MWTKQNRFLGLFRGTVYDTMVPDERTIYATRSIMLLHIACEPKVSASLTDPSFVSAGVAHRKREIKVFL